MCAKRRASPPLTVRLAAIAAALVSLVLGSAHLSRVQADETTHPRHDRQSWTPEQKMDEALRRGEELRKAMDELADPNTPCPRTKEEWDRAIETVAAWEAFNDLRSEIKRTLAGPLGQGNRGARFDKIFDGKKGLKRALEAKFQACDKSAIDEKDLTALTGRILRRAQERLAFERGLLGLAPLVIEVCPDCQKEEEERKKKRGVVPGGTGTPTTPTTPTTPGTPPR